MFRFLLCLVIGWPLISAAQLKYDSLLSAANSFYRSRNDSCLVISRVIFENGNTMKDSIIMAKALLLYGRFLNRELRTQDAIDFYDSISNSSGNISWTAPLALYGIGQVYQRIDSVEQAFSSYLKAVKLYKANIDYEGVSKANSRLGILMDLRKDSRQALTYFNEGVRYANLAGDTSLMITATGNLGICYQNLGQLQLAKTHLTRNLKLKELKGSSSASRSRSYHNLGLLYQNLNLYDSSIYYTEKAIEIRRTMNNPSLLSDSYNNLGFSYQESDKLQEALHYYKKSEELIDPSKSKFSARKLYSNLSITHAEKGEYKSAYEYLYRYDTLNETIFNETKSKQIAELQTKYETEKKDKEIKLSQAKIELTTSQNEKLMLTLFTSLGFTLIIILVYNQRQKAVKKLQEREKELHEQEVDELIKEQELKSINSMLEGEEKERKRVAEDLHDRVGSMLSAVKLQADPANREMVKLLDETAEEVRRISHNLETKVLNRFGLVAALEDLAEKINSSEKVHLEVHHLDLDERLDNDVEINVYRIVQELVGNALKHSRATEITAQVNRIDPHLIISVEDNGIGFDTIRAKASGGMGLKNVTSRAEQLNGEMNIDSGKGQGTAITIELPL